MRFFEKTIVTPKNPSLETLIRYQNSKTFSIKTIIDFKNNFINKAYFGQLILKFKLIIFILKDFIKHFEYFHGYLTKSISSRDFLKKLL